MRSLRIQTIANMVGKHALMVYDLCCDHGQIGLSVTAREVILLDVVESIIDKIKTTDIPSGITAICEDATNTKFNITPQTSFILAGIGGHLAIKILNNLYSQRVSGMEIVFCIHSHVEEVYQWLEGKEFEGLDFSFVEENQKFYEIYKLKLKSENEFKARDFFIKNSRKVHPEYLKERLSYFELKNRFDSSFLPWLEFYRARLTP